MVDGASVEVLKNSSAVKKMSVAGLIRHVLDDSVREQGIVPAGMRLRIRNENADTSAPSA